MNVFAQVRMVYTRSVRVYAIHMCKYIQVYNLNKQENKQKIYLKEKYTQKTELMLCSSMKSGEKYLQWEDRAKRKTE